MIKINKPWEKRSLQKNTRSSCPSFLAAEKASAMEAEIHTLQLPRFQKALSADSLTGTGGAAEYKGKAESSHRHAPGGLQSLPAGTNANKCWWYLFQ